MDRQDTYKPTTTDTNTPLRFKKISARSSQRFGTPDLVQGEDSTKKVWLQLSVQQYWSLHRLVVSATVVVLVVEVGCCRLHFVFFVLVLIPTFCFRRCCCFGCGGCSLFVVLLLLFWTLHRHIVSVAVFVSFVEVGCCHLCFVVFLSLYRLIVSSTVFVLTGGGPCHRCFVIIFGTTGFILVE